MRCRRAARTTLCGTLGMLGALGALGALGVPSRAAALVPGPGAIAPQLRALVTIGSAEEDRGRVRQILGLDSTAGFLLRTARVDGTTPESAPHATILVPEVRSVWNSAIPSIAGGGPLWEGRGWNALVRAGVRAALGPVALQLAPELAWSENRPFDFVRVATPARSIYSSPFHRGRASADVPVRFGDEPLRVVYPGQSALTITAGPIAAGLSTENMFWGPGLRNGILMSDNAPGIPHGFLRTSHPISTPVGAVEARWIVGGLTESLVFDTSAADDFRSLSGFVMTLRLAAEPGLTLGAARTVVAPVGGRREIPSRASDVFTYWGGLPSDVGADTSASADQLTSLFARWVFPRAGTEVYAEWAREELPRSVRELLVAPQYSQGYTLGMQWAHRVGVSATVARVQLEATNLEQSRVIADRPLPPDFYSGRASPQGYTQRGRVIGAAIGPGASSQWIGGDMIAPRWQAGAFVERTRWDNDALYRNLLPAVSNFLRHDVSLSAGIRGGVDVGRLRLSGLLRSESRLNYLFQYQFGVFEPGPAQQIDVRNYTAALAVSVF